MPDLLIETTNHVRTLRLNRPAKRNALNHTLTAALLDGLREADRDPDVRAIVLAGAGKSFCAGADTSEFTALVPDAPDAVLARADLTAALHHEFSLMTTPIVGAVHGHALGGGAGLALACDLLLLGESAVIGYPELKHGIVAAVVMANLVRQAGRKAAFELVALGEPIDALRALALGIANRVVPDADLPADAQRLAETLAGYSPIAMAATKRVFHRVVDLPLAEALHVGRDTNVMMRGFGAGPK